MARVPAFPTPKIAGTIKLMPIALTKIRPRRHPRHDEALAALGAWALEASAHELDAALRREICALQRIDAELGDLLREILDRRLYRELGFERFDRYVEERTDVAPRTARRWVRLARGDSDTRAVATAFRGGQITGLQAEVVLPVAMGDAPPRSPA